MRSRGVAALVSLFGASCVLDASGLAPAAKGWSGGAGTGGGEGGATTTGSTTGGGGASSTGGSGGASSTGGSGGASSTGGSGGSGGSAGGCGDAVIDPGEDCDGSVLGGATCVSRGFAGGALACSPQCTFDETECVAKGCGNSIVEAGEACDDGETDACKGTCDATCKGPANTCGDGVARCGEACDGADLGGKDCTSFGFQSPTGLKCAACQLDPSGCKDTCGDGVLDPGEACDDGNLSPANGATDFCSADCKASSWPCGAWPGAIPATSSGASIVITSVGVGGSKSRYAKVGASTLLWMEGHYDYDVANSGCPGCRTQIDWGLFAGDPPASNADPATGFQVCVDFVNQYSDFDFNGWLKTPAQPGTYFLRWERTWQNGCVAAADPGPSRNIAVVCVQ